MSVDPLIQGVGNSQGINPYAYVMNNPLSFTDPSGYQVKSLDDDVPSTGSRTGAPAAGARLKSQQIAGPAGHGKGDSKGNGSSNSTGTTTETTPVTVDLESKEKKVDENPGGDASGETTSQEKVVNNGCNQSDTCKSGGNPVTPVNLGVAVGGFAAGLAEVNKADILKPKQNVTQHKQATLNKPRIGVAKNSREVLVNISGAGKAVAKALAVAGVAISTTEAIVDIRNPSLSENQKIGSGIKAGTDISVIILSGAAGGIPGLVIAGGYLVSDYLFDFKSSIQEGVKNYRREEENQ